MLGGLACISYAQTITTFDVPNSTETVAEAINSAGRVTGFFGCSSEPDKDCPQSFLRLRDGTIITFGVFDSGRFWGTEATDINPSGEIVGTFFEGNVANGFLRRTDGTILTFHGSGGTSTPSTVLTEPAPRVDCVDGTAGIAINTVGQITGSFGQGCILGFLRQRDGTSALFQAGQGIITQQSTIPQAINAKAYITGYFTQQDDSIAHGFLRRPDGSIVTFDVPSSAGTVAKGINRSGQIAGSYQDTNMVSHGFLRQPDGTFTTFDPTGSIDTEVRAINQKGEITGFYASADGVFHGFLRNEDGVIESFDASDAANANTFPRDINDLGQIAGYYQDANLVLHGFVRSQ